MAPPGCPPAPQADDRPMTEQEVVAGVLGVHHLVARRHVERGALAVVVELPVADRQDLALLRLLLRGFGHHDADASVSSSSTGCTMSRSARGFRFTGWPGRLPGHLRAGCDPCAERALRRNARSPAGARDRWPAATHGARHALLSGGRPREPLQGRRARVCPDRRAPSAGRPPRRPRRADRARRANGHMRDRPQ
jgi:hypothetical protein